MKLFYFSCLVLVLLNVFSFQLANSEESAAPSTAKPTDPAAKDDNADPTGTDPKTEDAKETSEDAQAANTEQGGSSPSANSESSSNNETKTDGEGDSNAADNKESTEETDKDTTLADLDVGDACKGAIASCLSAMENAPNLDKVKCDEVKSEKACFTNSTAANKCSEEDYTKLEDSICFCPRFAPSIFLVAILCVLGKLLGNQ